MRRGMNTFPIACCLLAVGLGASAGDASAKVPDAQLLPSGRAMAPASAPLDSRGFMRWGSGGPGQWVRIYANDGHVFAVIAGLRWDTSMTTESDSHGPGWSEEMRSTGGFRLRHPLGLLRAG